MKIALRIVFTAMQPFSNIQTQLLELTWKYLRRFLVIDKINNFQYSVVVVQMIVQLKQLLLVSLVENLLYYQYKRIYNRVNLLIGSFQEFSMCQRILGPFLWGHQQILGQLQYYTWNDDGYIWF